MKNNLTHKRTLVALTGGIIAAYALAATLMTPNDIMQYDTRKLYSHDDLERAKAELERAQTIQTNTVERLTNSRYVNDQLHSDTRYIKLLTQLDMINTQLENSERYSMEKYQDLWAKREDLLDAMALREDSLRIYYVDRHPDMIMANKLLEEAEKHFNTVQQNCIAHDSIKQIPLSKRLKSNLEKHK